MSEPVNFGIVMEDLEKVLKAATLASNILQVMEKNYKNDFYTETYKNYKFISEEMNTEIVRKLENSESIADEYQKEIDKRSFTLEFPQVKINYNTKSTELSIMISDYRTIVHLLNDVFVKKTKFIKSDMTYMNTVNNYILPLYEKIQ